MIVPGVAQLGPWRVMGGGGGGGGHRKIAVSSTCTHISVKPIVKL